MLNIHPIPAPEAPAPLPLLLERVPAAKYLTISPRSLDRMIKNGEIPIIKLGRTVRLSIADLQEVIDKNRQRKQPPPAPAAVPPLNIAQNNPADDPEPAPPLSIAQHDPAPAQNNAGDDHSKAIARIA